VFITQEGFILSLFTKFEADFEIGSRDPKPRCFLTLNVEFA